jgi:AcrR family transcriptional regulator
MKMIQVMLVSPEHKPPPAANGSAFRLQRLASVWFYVYIANIQDMFTMSTSESRYHHGDLRAALIAIALTHLSKGGSDISLRELAREAGVSPTAAYRHFASKEDLLAALADEGFRKLSERQVPSISDKPSDRLFAALMDYMAFARAEPSLYALMFGRLHVDGPGLPQRTSSFASLTSLIAAVDPAATPADALRVWSTVHGCATLVLSGLIGQERLKSGAIEAVLGPLAENPACRVRG